MQESQIIEKRKQQLKLPFHRDQIEYWGPISNDFSDAFLSMGRLFLQQFLVGVHVRLIKGVFSSFVELVQNIAEYHQIEFEENIPQSFVNLVIEKELITISTLNQVKEKDVVQLTELFEKLFSLSKEELKKAYRDSLFEGESLGLIMIKKLINSNLEWEISKDKEGINWLSLELKINYENT